MLVVEHDKEMIEQSDFVVDLGPGAGEHGGRVVAVGEPGKLKMKSEKLKVKGRENGVSSTIEYLQGKKKIEIPNKRREGSGKYLTLKGAAGNNLKNVTVKIPLGMFVCVTGVSGSGKSSLINRDPFSDSLKKIL